MLRKKNNVCNYVQNKTDMHDFLIFIKIIFTANLKTSMLRNKNANIVFCLLDKQEY